MTHKTKGTSFHLFSGSEFLSLLTGVAFVVFALKGFMLPNLFLDGGVTGISLLVHELFHWDLSILLFVFNIGFIWWGYKKMGKSFAIKSCIAVLLLIAGLNLIHVTPVTTDKLLIALFGGLSIGIGMGLVIRAGAAIDGFEIMAVLFTRRIGLSVSEMIMIFDSIIFLTAAFQFGIETAMYSIITYFAATRASDYIVDGLEQYTAVTIISARYNEIKSLIVNDFRKGISVYKGERGYLPGAFDKVHKCDIITTVVTRLEFVKLKDAILSTDPNAFIFLQSVKEAKGGVLKKKAGH